MNRLTYKSFVVTGIATLNLAAMSCAGQSGWSVQQGSGFQVSAPSGWSAQGAKDGHTFIHNADRSVFALVQPFKLGEGEAGETIAPLVNHMSSLFPNAQVSTPKQVSSSPDEAIAKVTYDGSTGKGQANVLCVLANGQGMLYAIGAPSSEFRTERRTLIKVLESFKYGVSGSTSTGAGSRGGVGSVSFEEWTEPHESMFTTEVPQGWHVFGGAYRFAPVDVRTQVSVVSPDGSITVQNGAAKLTTFAVPGPSSQMRGLRNGQQYNVNGVTYTVMPYWSGPELAKEFAELKLKRDHPGLEITGTKERRDIEEFVNQKLGSSGNSASTGETDFRFTDHGRELEGACVGTTIQIGRGASAIWLAFPSYIIAPADEMSTGWKVWQQLILKRQDNPEWSSKQREITQQFNQMVAANHDAVMRQLAVQYQQAVRTLDENFRGADNMINGETDVRNPYTGQTAKVAAGSNYYWGRADGAVVGTSTYNPPDINFTPLEQF